MTVMEIAAAPGIPAAEDDLQLQPYDLYTADEAFFCSTQYLVLASP